MHAREGYCEMTKCKKLGFGGKKKAAEKLNSEGILTKHAKTLSYVNSGGWGGQKNNTQINELLQDNFLDKEVMTVVGKKGKARSRHRTRIK